MKFLISPRKKFLDERASQQLNREIETLGEFVCGAGMDVYLVGGVAVALTVGNFYRNHSDFDLALFDRNLGDFYEYCSSRGYELVTREGFPSLHISPFHHLYVVSETDPRRALNKAQTRLRILLKGEGLVRMLRSRTDYIDLFLLQERGRYIRSAEYGVDIPKEEFFPVQNFSVKNGFRLSVPNLKGCLSRIGVRKPKQAGDFARLGLSA